MVKAAKHSGNWGNTHLRSANYAMYLIAHKKSQGYFYNKDGMKRWIRDNTHPHHSSHVTEVPIIPNVCKLKNEHGKIARKQENSHAEVYGILRTYCPSDGTVPTTIMDPYCGSGVLCLGGIRQSVTAMYMNDQDPEIIQLARARALQYFVGCEAVGLVTPDGQGSWVGQPPSPAEIEYQAMFALGRIIEDRTARPENNYPKEYKRNTASLAQQCSAANVFVADSSVKSDVQGLFAKMSFIEGAEVVPLVGKLYYDEKAMKSHKFPERVWNCADDSFAAYLEGCVFSPATKVQNGSDAKTLGTAEAVLPNLMVKIDEKRPLSDSGRYTYVTTRAVKPKEEFFADFTKASFKFRQTSLNAAAKRKRRRSSGVKRSRGSDDETDDDVEEVQAEEKGEAAEEEVEVDIMSLKKRKKSKPITVEAEAEAEEEEEEEEGEAEEEDEDVPVPAYEPFEKHSDGFRTSRFIDDEAGVSKPLARITRKSSPAKVLRKSSPAKVSRKSSQAKVPRAEKVLQSHLTTPPPTQPSKRKSRVTSKK